MYQSPPTALLLDAETLSFAVDAVPPNEKPMVVLLITRREVEQFDVGSIVDRLMAMSDDIKLVHRLEDSLLLTFDGYNDDRRELHEIPEVVRLIRAVAEQWNGWFHFLDMDSDALQILLRLLLDVRSLPPDPKDGRALSEIQDLKQARGLLLHLFEGMNRFYEICGYSIERNMTRTNAVFAAFDRALS